MHHRIAPIPAPALANVMKSAGARDLSSVKCCFLGLRWVSLTGAYDNNSLSGATPVGSRPFTFSSQRYHQPPTVVAGTPEVAPHFCHIRSFEFPRPRPKCSTSVG